MIADLDKAWAAGVAPRDSGFDGVAKRAAAETVGGAGRTVKVILEDFDHSAGGIVVIGDELFSEILADAFVAWIGADRVADIAEAAAAIADGRDELSVDELPGVEGVDRDRTGDRLVECDDDEVVVDARIGKAGEVGIDIDRSDGAGPDDRRPVAGVIEPDDYVGPDVIDPIVVEVNAMAGRQDVEA